MRSTRRFQQLLWTEEEPFVVQPLLGQAPRIKQGLPVMLSLVSAWGKRAAGSTGWGSPWHGGTRSPPGLQGEGMRAKKELQHPAHSPGCVSWERVGTLPVCWLAQHPLSTRGTPQQAGTPGAAPCLPLLRGAAGGSPTTWGCLAQARRRRR